MQRLCEILKQYWGYDRFLPLQEQAMSCVLEGKDSVVNLRTEGLGVLGVALEGLDGQTSALTVTQQPDHDLLFASFAVPVFFIKGIQTQHVAARMPTRQADRRQPRPTAPGPR